MDDEICAGLRPTPFDESQEEDHHVNREIGCTSAAEYDFNFEPIPSNYLSSSETDDDYNQKRPYIIRWKSGKRVDPRLLMVLESFRKIYVEKREFFKKIFPGMYDEFVDVFKKFGEMREKNKEYTSSRMESTRTRGLERSLSFGSSSSPRSNDELVNEKFRVKNPNVIVGGGTAVEGQGGAASSDPNKN